MSGEEETVSGDTSIVSRSVGEGVSSRGGGGKAKEGRGLSVGISVF